MHACKHATCMLLRTAPPCHIYTAALRAALVHRQGRACALSRQACARPALPARTARAPLAAGPAAPPPPRHGASSPHWAGLLLSRVPLPVPDRTPPCDACTHPAPTAHRTGRPYSGARWPTRCARPSGPRARRGPRASSSAAGLACHPPQRSSSRGSSATRGSTGPTCVRGKGQSKKKRPLFLIWWHGPPGPGRGAGATARTCALGAACCGIRACCRVPCSSKGRPEAPRRRACFALPPNTCVKVVGEHACFARNRAAPDAGADARC